LMLPGIFIPGDDSLLRTGLHEVDSILYNPSMLPSIPAAVTEFIPESAAYLATNFRVTEVLEDLASVGQVSHPTTLLLERIEPDAGEVVTDVWSQTLAPNMSRESWLMYRVLVVDGSKPDSSCFAISHPVESGQTLSFLPMTAPDRWVSRRRTGGDSIAFEVYADPPHAERTQLYAQRIPAGALPRRIRLPLDAYAGREISLRFCVDSADRSVGESAVAGWGELQILEGS